MRTLALFVAAMVLVGCALRPRYAEFVSKETTAPVKLQVVEKRSGAPVPGASIEVGEFRGRVSVKTDADGYFLLPVDKKLLDENSLIVITAPGYGQTTVVVASAGAPPAATLPEPVVTESAPLPVPVVIQPMDAGNSFP
jgi:hypothetical protein